MTNTFSYASYCDARSRFHKTATIGFGHGYIRFGDDWRSSPKILFLVVPSGKFRLNWSGLYFIRKLASEGVAWLMDLDKNQFSELTNVDHLKNYYA